MKRVVSLIVAVLMLIGIASAEMIRTDDSTMFAQGIELLRQINDLRSVEAAEDVFASITSGYNSANYFKMYAQALEDLHNGEYSSALMRLDILEGDNTFAAMLKQYSLPSCKSVRVYTEGRQAEEEGRYDDASELYAQANILDSLDRIFELKSRATELTYERAVALFDAGKYAEAADLFMSLGNYMDSAERARQATALIPTPEPTPTPSPTPVPTPTPEPTPTPAPIISSDDLKLLRSLDVGNTYMGGDADFMGHGDVTHSIVIHCEGLKAPLVFDSVSWTDNCEDFYENGCMPDVYPGMLNGITYVENGNAFDGTHEYVGIYLPDNESIAGKQTISLRCANVRIDIVVKLIYEGGYINGTGWWYEFESCRIIEQYDGGNTTNDESSESIEIIPIEMPEANATGFRITINNSRATVSSYAVSWANKVFDFGDENYNYQRIGEKIKEGATYVQIAELIDRGITQIDVEFMLPPDQSIGGDQVVTLHYEDGRSYDVHVILSWNNGWEGWEASLKK